MVLAGGGRLFWWGMLWLSLNDDNRTLGAAPGGRTIG